MYDIYIASLQFVDFEEIKKKEKRNDLKGK